MKDHGDMHFELAAHLDESLASRLTGWIVVAKNSVELLPDDHRAGGLLEMKTHVLR